MKENMFPCDKEKMIRGPRYVPNDGYYDRGVYDKYYILENQVLIYELLLKIAEKLGVQVKEGGA